MNEMTQTVESQLVSKYPLDLSKLPRDAWRPSLSAGKRITQRTTEREVEKIPAWISLVNHKEWVLVKLWDYSLYGFGILLSNIADMEAFSTAGTLVQIKIHEYESIDRSAVTIHVLPCRIENFVRVEKGFRIGLKRLDLPKPQNEEIQNLPTGHLYDNVRPLTAKILTPFLYKEWVEAKLIGLGPQRILIFESKDPSLFLVVGARVTLDLEIPVDTAGICTGNLTWIRPEKNGRVTFAISNTDISFDLSNAIGEHFIEAEICTPHQLPKFGIILKRFKDQFQVRFITTQEEFDAVLILRKAAYVGSGKADSNAPVQAFGNKYDTHSRLLAAFHGEILVASVALNFGGSEEKPFRSQTEFPNSTYPVPIPPKDTIIEIQSLCTDFEYRGGDLIQTMFEHIGRCVVFSNRQWMLTFTSEKLWPLYKRIGFKKLGASVPIHALGGLEHHLILCHKDALTTGLGMSPLAWNYFFGQMIRELIKKGQIRFGIYHKARYEFYSLFAGITQRWMRAKLERDFKDLLERKIEKEKTND